MYTITSTTTKNIIANFALANDISESDAIEQLIDKALFTFDTTEQKTLIQTPTTTESKNG